MKTQLIIAGFAFCLNANAQTLQDAISKTANERYEAAAADFKVIIAKEASKGENYFYFGENYFDKGDLDSANIQYQKGSEVNATNPLNYVGLGKVLLNKGKEADAKTMFYKAATLGANKNTEVIRQTAKAYINSEIKNLDEAITQLNNAIKLDAKNPENYILLGDALLEKNPTDGSAPIKNYQKANELNPKSTTGILREGKLYQRGRNFQLAIDLYKKALSIDGTFAPAYRELAEVYMMAGRNKDAIEYWKKYLELNNSNYARYKFMTALYNNKQYQEALAEGEDLRTNGYNNLFVERLLGYAYCELGDKTKNRIGCDCNDGTTSDATGPGACASHGGVKQWKFSNEKDTAVFLKGLRSINKFFEMSASTQGFKYLPTDYKYKGMLLSKTGKDSLGTVELEKAIALDAVANCELWSDVAKIWSKAKNHNKAIAAWEKRAGCTKPLTGQENFENGRSYYFEAGARIRQKKEADAPALFVKADSCFSKLTQSATSFPAGYFWRGKVNSQLDPKNERWQAKPYYEKALTLVKQEEKTSTYKKDVIEALEYLGNYFVVSKDKEKSDATFNELKTIDPNNEKAKNYFAPPKGK